MKRYTILIVLFFFMFIIQYRVFAQYDNSAHEAMPSNIAANKSITEKIVSGDRIEHKASSSLSHPNLDTNDEYVLQKNSPEFVKMRLRQLERQLYEKTRNEVIQERRAYREIDPVANMRYYSERDELKNLTSDTLNEVDIEREVQRRMDGEVILKLFGRDFFESGRLDRTTLFETNAPSDYILGSGDEIKVIIWSDLGDQTVYDIQINPQGQIYVPTLGMMVVSGKNIVEIQNIVLGQLRKKFPHFRGQVSLTRLKSMQIYMAGEVERPGSLIVSGLSTAFSALYQAGGPNRRGSMRNITVTTAKGKSRKLDLYKYLLTGDRSQDFPISNGDTIFVPMAGKRVSACGMLARPAIYEIDNETTLAEVIEMAGGVLPDAYTGRVSITRWDGIKMRKSYDLNLEDKQQLNNFIMQDGDEIKVDHAVERVGNKVTIQGPVYRPGSYAIGKELTLKDLIERCGGVIKEEINMSRGQIYRKQESGKQTIIPFNLKYALSGDKENNIVLKPFDIIKLFAEDELQSDVLRITIDGAIRRPGNYIFRTGMKLADLIVKARGLALDADETVEIARINENNEVKIIKANVKKALEDAFCSDNIELKALDRVAIPSNVEKRSEVDIVVIKGQVAKPGPYALTHKGEKLSSLIKRAGGLTSMAFPEGCIFMRKAEHIGNENQINTAQKMQDELYRLATQELKANILLKHGGYGVNNVASLNDRGENIKSQVIDGYSSVKPGQEAIDVTQSQRSIYSDLEMASRSFSREAIRIPIPLKNILNGTADDYEDINLLDGDQIIIPITPNTVSIVGAVMNPATVLYNKKNTNAGYYINKCGGFNKNSDHKKTTVIKANGEVIRLRECKNIEHGDIILVPPKARVLREHPLKLFGELTQSLANLAVIYKVISDD